MNLRPDGLEEKEEEVTKKTEGGRKETYVKTSIALSRDIAVRARKYVSEQQLAYAQGQRHTNYSFSQLFNDALNVYLDTLEKGESNEKFT